MRTRPLPRWLALTVIAISLPLILPFLYVVVRAYEVGWERSIELLFRPYMWDLLSNTLLLMVCVTAFSIILGIVSAFLFERFRFFGKSFFQTAMTLPLCIPAFVSCFTWISLTFRVEGFWGTIMIMSLSSFPLAYLPVSATLKRLDRSMEEVSLSLGKTRWQTFRYAVLPQLKPAIGSSILLIALHMLVEFGAVSILNYQTFTTAIFQEYEMSFNNSTAALLSAVLIAICGMVVLSESVFRGKVKLFHSGKGVIRPYPVKKLTPLQQIPLIAFFGTLFTLSIVVPFSMLIYWLIVGSSHDNLTDFASFFDAFGHSLLISALGAAVTVLCALPLVWAAIRYRSRLTVWIDRLPYLLHAVPGLVIALSLIYFSVNYAKPVYQTFIVVVIAYFMLYLPMAQTTLRSSLEQLPQNMEKVGQTLGRNPVYIFRTLIVPAILPGITAAFALVFLNLMKELTATLLLTANDVHTLSTALWEYTSDAQYAAATPYALMLVIFSGIPVFLLKKYAFK
ncbi:iron ABC transporter permease [Neisseria sp. ZJ106]|uniref:Iron ABC transporter permease n=1 Tax=Neisseria lisongii TaxID=2912188 RepID=A0AAW5AJU3_9NEIS|nr:iron ABC transporter permease [Neisseria lisongii]MCF7521696.1 iron ABC transporter permease [Neisseria lisongii]MCF7528741.1 iron ABC transporter permease [Neisseria lisongii]MCF7529599.1 iron ABC transporter permease [Neisseria lisongii]WCL72219.1 iron ABC transporter permease [Neisseria lisongii]